MAEQEPVMDYKVSALAAVHFKLVYTEEDLDRTNEKCQFKPEMAHQVFGDGETIFGYKNLSIDLYYLHNSTKCFMGIKYSDQIKNFEPDQLVDLLNPWLPSGYVSKLEEFRKIVQNEKHDQIFGTIIKQFEHKTEVISLPGKCVTCQYKITQCDTQDKLFQEYHQRFETFIIWFIDAANFIALDDQRWIIFYIYEEFEHPETKETVITPIGYTAIYKFFSYPSSNRARISQFFILPTHQRKGLGTELYKAVYKTLLTDMPDVVDITVEEPSQAFQKMRDFCDSSHIYKDIQANNVNIQVKSPKLLNKYMAKHKLGKRQASKVLDVLQYYTALKGGQEQVKSFKARMKDKIEAQVTRDYSTHKRARAVAPVENQDPEILIAENFASLFNNYLREIKFVCDKLLCEFN